MNTEPSQILSEQEMRCRRKAESFVSWWEQKHAEFSRTKESRHYCRYSKDPLVKRFYEELRPMARAVEILADQMAGLECEADVGYEAHDGVIYDAEGRVYPVQITYAKNGYHEAVQTERLKEAGCVNITFPPIILGSGRNRIVSFVEDEMIDVETVYAEMRGLIVKRMQQKSLSERYDDHMVLVIYFDDHRLDEEDWPEWDNFCASLAHPFFALMILGSRYAWHNFQVKTEKP